MRRRRMRRKRMWRMRRKRMRRRRMRRQRHVTKFKNTLKIPTYTYMYTSEE